MFFEIINEELKPKLSSTDSSGDNHYNVFPRLGLFTIEELPVVLEKFQIKTNELDDLINRSISNADHHSNFDIIHIEVLNLKKLKTENQSVIIYKDKNNLCFFTKKK